MWWELGKTRYHETMEEFERYLFTIHDIIIISQLGHLSSRELIFVRTFKTHGQILFKLPLWEMMFLMLVVLTSITPPHNLDRLLLWRRCCHDQHQCDGYQVSKWANVGMIRLFQNTTSVWLILSSANIWVCFQHICLGTVESCSITYQ